MKSNFLLEIGILTYSNSMFTFALTISDCFIEENAYYNWGGDPNMSLLKQFFSI